MVISLFSGCSGKNVSLEQDISEAPSAEELPLPEEYTNEGNVTEISTTMMRNPKTLHPIFVTDEDTLNILSLICEPAIAFDASDMPKASVIESWTYDEPTASMLFNVRKGVKFHNGANVTAYDIKYCLDLIMLASEQDCIYAKYKGVVSNYEAVDEYTLKLGLAMRSADIYYLMNFPVIPESVYSTLPQNTNSIPVGTGAYTVSSYTVDGGMELTLNENWWRTLPSITRITAHAVEDNESKLAGYQMGEYNFVAMTTMTANSYKAQKNTSVYKTSTLYYETLIPNISNRFLQDINVRRAISLALDRREIISTGVLGGGIAATTPIKNDRWQLEGSSSEIIEYDTAKAETLLEEAGYHLNSANGRRYSLNADGSYGYINLELIYCEYEELYYRNTVTSLIKNDLSQIGIEITVKELSRAQYEKALSAGDFDIALASLGERQPELKAYLMRFQEERLQRTDFFDSLSLDFDDFDF